MYYFVDLLYNHEEIIFHEWHMCMWMYFILILTSFLAAFISGAAGFGGALLLLPVDTACVGAEVAVPVLAIAQLIGNLSRMAF